MWLRVIWHIAVVLCLVITGLTVLMAIGVLFDPTSNIVTYGSSNFWPVVGPHLVLLSLVALVVGLAGLRRRPRRLATITSIVAATALLASMVITGQILGAVAAAGGSANPITGLWLSSTTPPPDARETYTTADGQPLQALIWRSVSDGSTAPGISGDAPVMLYIHGGGWIGGKADFNASDFRWFAERGWLVVSVEYSLATASETTWNKAPQEVACALSWAAQNAPRFGGDPGRIVVAGNSAGGNLAINLAYSAALGQAESSCGGQVPVPSAVVVVYPVVDPQDAYDHGYPLSGTEPQVFTSRYIGGTPQQFPDRMRAISSATYLSAKAPQTLIIEPEKDGLIPSLGVYRFVEQARASGADITLARIPFANHGYDQQWSNSIGNQARLSISQHYAEQQGLIQGQK